MKHVTTVFSPALALLSWLVLGSPLLYAHPARFHKERALSTGHLAIELAGREADMTFTALSKDVYGIADPPPESDLDAHRIIEDVKFLVRNSAKQLVQFSPDLGCTTRAYVVAGFIGSHSQLPRDSQFSTNEPLDPLDEADLRAALALPQHDCMIRLHTSCASDIRGHDIRFGFTAALPAVTRVKVYLFDGMNIKASEIDRDQGSIMP